MYSNLNLEVKREMIRGDIWLVDFDNGMGSEQKGLRPATILQNDTGNKFSPTVIVVPITSQINKAKLPTHVEVKGYGLEKDSVALAEQIRVVDKRRLKSYIGHVDNVLMEKIEEATNISLNLGDTQKERIAKDKALKIEKIEYALATLAEYGQTDNIIFQDKLKTRELYLKDLESFCLNNKLNYKDFYKPEQKQAMAV